MGQSAKAQRYSAGHAKIQRLVALYGRSVVQAQVRARSLGRAQLSCLKKGSCAGNPCWQLFFPFIARVMAVGRQEAEL